MNKGKQLERTAECAAALEEFEKVVAQPPVNLTPLSGEALFLYLVESSHAVSTMLVRKRRMDLINKWMIELGGYGLYYESQTAAKSQVWTDFVAKFSHNLQAKAKIELAHMKFEEARASPGLFTLTEQATIKEEG